MWRHSRNHTNPDYTQNEISRAWYTVCMWIEWDIERKWRLFCLPSKKIIYRNVGYSLILLFFVHHYYQYLSHNYITLKWRLQGLLQRILTAGARHFLRGDWLSQMQLTSRLSPKLCILNSWNKLQFFWFTRNCRPFSSLFIRQGEKDPFDRYEDTAWPPQCHNFGSTARDGGFTAGLQPPAVNMLEEALERLIKRGGLTSSGESAVCNDFPRIPRAMAAHVCRCPCSRLPYSPCLSPQALSRGLPRPLAVESGDETRSSAAGGGAASRRSAGSGRPASAGRPANISPIMNEARGRVLKLSPTGAGLPPTAGAQQPSADSGSSLCSPDMSPCSAHPPPRPARLGVVPAPPGPPPPASHATTCPPMTKAPLQAI